MKKIETVYLKPSDLKKDFGNPRRITKQKLDELKKSIEKLGDFGVIVIDENNNVISGNQRLQAMKQLNIETPILCKKLIGYSDAEKKAINIRANVNSGDFDNVMLQKWVEDIKIEINDIDVVGIKNIEISENIFKNEKQETKIKEVQCKKCGFIWQE